MLRFYFFIGSLLLAYPFWAQELVDEAYFDTEGLLLDQFVILTSDTTNEAKDIANTKIGDILVDFLANPESFDETFELKNLGKITSPDNKINIFTWNYIYSRHLYKYGGVVQFRSQPSAKPIVYRLTQSVDQIPHDQVDQNKWYGCLYYKIIQNKEKENTIYTLFGWDGFNSVISRKVVDVISINRNGVVLGKPIFYMEKGRMNRMLFQYNAQSVMMLDYEESKQRIVFDHLSPSSPEDKGDFRMYGPDSTYDGLEFKKGKWYLKKNIDLRMNKKEGKLGKPKKIKKMKAPK